jgi:hypothetical protein
MPLRDNRHYIFQHGSHHAGIVLLAAAAAGTSNQSSDMANSGLEDAARKALKKISEQSNSLYPYELVKITGSQQVNDKPDTVEIDMVVSRGPRLTETFKVAVAKGRPESGYELIEVLTEDAETRGQ